MFDFFDDWNPIIRWIIFIPIMPLFYFLGLLLIHIGFEQYLGNYNENGFFSYIFYRPLYDIVVTGVGILLSCMCAPKGRILIASLYLAVLILILGMTISGILLGHATLATWKYVYSGITMLTGAIFPLITIIKLENYKRNKNKDDIKPISV